MTVNRVLLVCTGNTCRSPMASALLSNLWQKAAQEWTLEVSSAGTGAFPGLPATDYAVAAMRKKGHDLTVHRSRTVTDETLAGTDLVLTMTTRQKEYILRLWPDMQGRVHTLGEYAGTGADIPDPFGGAMAEYEGTAEVLTTILPAVVDRIGREGNPLK